ncbi:uncharacterized protein EV422DRAFT_527651 [Fimicolochytrium jonesii]|uniref:uncharacterized protein n=1 Tax=Fimicolochytrium jonesii TaxID=1396493 RepID=UPI0022FF0412|nr:uncharacterized protein EV422DRAFT_527651 [Fimicolochytrium jonesii]KAI8821312.1 hypothetical protein EV422DRAFT_527651 [Fimicolochytrium jonesii]
MLSTNGVSYVVECPVCAKQFQGMHSVYQHVWDVHYICRLQPECLAVFVTGLGREEHEKHDHAFCEACELPFHSEEDLYEHHNSSHCDHPCPECPRVYALEKDLRWHRANEHCYRCEHCGRGFRMGIDLANHIASKVHQRRKMLYPNGIGSTHLSKDRDLTAAERALRRKRTSSKSSQCVICSITYTTTYTAADHLKAGECSEKIAALAKARAEYLQRKGFTTLPHQPHLTSLDDDETRPIISDDNPSHPLLTHNIFDNLTPATEASWNNYAYECPICTCEYLSLSRLNFHLVTHHPLPEEYVCATCHTQFDRLAPFVKHYEDRTCAASSSTEDPLTGSNHSSTAMDVDDAELIVYESDTASVARSSTVVVPDPAEVAGQVEVEFIPPVTTDAYGTTPKPTTPPPRSPTLFVDEARFEELYDADEMAILYGADYYDGQDPFAAMDRID